MSLLVEGRCDLSLAGIAPASTGPARLAEALLAASNTEEVLRLGAGLWGFARYAGCQWGRPSEAVAGLEGWGQAIPTDWTIVRPRARGQERWAERLAGVSPAIAYWPPEGEPLVMFGLEGEGLGSDVVWCEQLTERPAEPCSVYAYEGTGLELEQGLSLLPALARCGDTAEIVEVLALARAQCLWAAERAPCWAVRPTAMQRWRKDGVGAGFVAAGFTNRGPLVMSTKRVPVKVGPSAVYTVPAPEQWTVTPVWLGTETAWARA